MTGVATPAGAVIFDLDGTLVDSNYLHTLAWSRALRAAGEWAPMNAIHRLIGMGADQLLPRLIGREDQAVSARRDEEYQALIGEVLAFPGAERLLRGVHELRLGVVLATSSAKDEYDAVIGLVGGEELVDAHTTIDDIRRSKPAPDVFRTALELAGVSADDAVVVGDSPWDVKAASAAGLDCVAVESGGTSRDELLAAGALEVWRDVGELADRLEHSAIGALARRCATS